MMEDIVYHTNYRLENEYWWFVARNKILFDLIESRCKITSGRMLDVGCGTGGFAKLMSDRFDVTCLDTSPIALDYCRQRGLKNLVNSDLNTFAQKSEKFDLITTLDVLEHIDDDLSVIKAASSLLSDKGWFVATVPAYQWLWSQHDVIHRHVRRYTLGRFKQRLEAGNFRIEYSSYFNTFLFPPAVAKRLIEKVLGSEKKETQPVDNVSQFQNRLFTSIFLSEENILKHCRMPFGLSIMAICKKIEN
jgi:SAM-dependent methyltransferase